MFTRARRDGAIWLGAGVFALLAIQLFQWDPQLYLLAGGIAVYGVALLVLGVRDRTTCSPPS